MNIAKINIINNYSKTGFVNTKQNLNKAHDIQKQDDYKPLSYPTNYYISFTGTSIPKTIAELYANRDKNGMPSLVAKYIEEHKEVGCSYDIKSVHQEAYRKLNDCHTVTDIKKTFGDSEKCFTNLKYLGNIESGNDISQQLFYKIAQEELQGRKILNCEDDIVTFITKQIFLECKSYHDTMQALKAVLTKEGSKFSSLIPEKSSSIGGRFFEPLGLKVPNGTTYGASLRKSNDDTQVSRKLSKIFFCNDILPLDEAELIKTSVCLMDAWNNSFDIRKDLSKFMFYKKQSPVYSIKSEDFTDVVTLNSYTDEDFKNRMQLLMEAFWNEHPDHAKNFGTRLNAAKEKYDLMQSKGEQEYQDYLMEIYNVKSQQQKKLKEHRVTYKDPYETAKSTLVSWLEKVKPLRLNTKETYNKIVNLILLKGKLNEEELSALQGDINNPLFKKLVEGRVNEGGLIDKIKSIENDTTYRRMLNAQSFSIVDKILKTSGMTPELELAFESGKKLSEYTKSLKRKLQQAPKKLTDSILQAIKHNEARLTEQEQLKLAEYLLSNSDFLEIKDVGAIKRVLSVQGKFLNAILGNNEQLKDLALTIFWSEYDRSFETSTLSLYKQTQNDIKLQNEKLRIIEELDWFDIAINIDQEN